MIIKHDDELYRYMMHLLVVAAKEGVLVPERVLPDIATEITHEIQHKLIPLMLVARRNSGELVREPRSTLLPHLLDPRYFQHFFGASIRKNVLARLKELQHEAKERKKEE